MDVALAARGGKGGNGGFGAKASTTTTAAAAATTTTAAASTSAASNTTSDATASDLQLNPANVQTGSQSSGQAVTEAGQSPSDTDPANFINFCTGKTLTNGLQVKGGSCNGIVMGDMPASTNMISTIITNPGPGQDIAPNTDFSINVQITNLVAGTFTNPTTTYYAAPQTLEGGNIVGHTHVTVQALTSLDTPTPPDPAIFQFFKGINDAGNGQGALSAAVAGGLPSGIYRVCTIVAASNHQPVLMPVAQRGGQDDCQKFTVGQGGGSGSSASNTSDTAAATTTTAAAATTTAAAAGGKKGGKGGKGRFAVRKFAA